jgi:hypothetical protein
LPVEADEPTGPMWGLTWLLAESVWSLFKRSLVGSYHHLSAKRLQAYPDEFAFRYDNRENAYVFRDALLRLIGSERLAYAELIAKTA